MPTLRRILLGLLLATACTSPALADGGPGQSTRFSGNNFEGTARSIDADRMRITFDVARFYSDGEDVVPMRPRRSRVVYNVRTGRVVGSKDVNPESKASATKRFEATLPANLGPSEVVTSLTRQRDLNRTGPNAPTQRRAVSSRR